MRDDLPRSDLAPGPRPRTVRDPEGVVHDVPSGWELLPPGDAGVTRAVKGMGPTWTVAEKRGRKVFSQGIWAPAAHIARARAEVEVQRADPGYQRRLDAGRRRRAEEQVDYVREFEGEVFLFLRFHPRHAAVATDLAARVTAHATPVGSGTVARTERIPVERRAEAAVIAWMRHQTTAYDDMSVARVKGARRELRRELAERSRAVLGRYRRGETPEAGCPLARALALSPAPDAAPGPASAGALPAVARPVGAPATGVVGGGEGRRAGGSLPAGAGRGSAPPPAPARAVAGPSPAGALPPAAAPGQADPAAPPDPRLAPRNAHEEAQQALYLKVRARLTRR